MFWWLCLTSAGAHSSSQGLCESLLARAPSNCHITRPTLISTSTASVSSAGAVAVPPLPKLKSREDSCLHWRGSSL
jgi:hypothetical protein